MPEDSLNSSRPPLDASDIKIPAKMESAADAPVSAEVSATPVSEISPASATSAPTTADEEGKRDSSTTLLAGEANGTSDSIAAKLRGTSTVKVTHPGSGSGRSEPIYVEDDVRFEKTHFVMPKHYQDSLGYILLPKGLVNDRIEKLAMEIRREYGDEEVHVLCILKGSRGFFSELLATLDKIHRYSMHTDYQKAPYMEHYIRLKSYQNMESTGQLHVMSDDLTCLTGKHVLIVEDIIDTGHTLIKFCAHLDKFKPATVKVTSLLEKRTDKSSGFKGDFIGFSIPDVFAVGYCLDYNEHFRDLDHICVMNKLGIEKWAE